MRWNTRRRWLFLSALLAVLISLTSCRNDGRLPVYSVKGKVLVDGKPVKDAFVHFYPRDTVGQGTPCPSAQTDENGEFALSSYVSGDGVPPGEYDVTVTWPVRFNPLSTNWEGDKLKGRYSDRKKPWLQVTIEKKPLELAPFDLYTSSPEK